MKLYYISLYYKSKVVTGANKRFDEIGKRLLSQYGQNFKCIVSSGEKPPWCHDKNLAEIPIFLGKYGRLKAWLNLSIMLCKAPPGIVYSDFMPIPLLFNRHMHYQLIHDLRNFNEFKRGGLGALTGSFQKYQLKKADKTVTVSNFSAAELVSCCDLERSDVITSYNGVERKLLLTKQNREIDVLYVATFEPRKNHTTLLKALYEIEKSLKVVFIGRDLGLREQIEREASEVVKLTNHTITFIDSVTESELESYYLRSKVFCSPSHYEGFGMPLIEARQYGCVIACSDIDVFQEVTMANAFFFDQTNKLSTARILTEAIFYSEQENAYRELLSMSKEITEHYSWDSITQRLVSVFDD